MGTHTGRGFTISFTIFLVLLSTERNDLPLGVDEEDEWKYELPTILVRSSAERQAAVLRRIRVQPGRGQTTDGPNRTHHSLTT
jgi:hypothetical protein